MGPSALADQLPFFKVQIWCIYRVSPKPLAIWAKMHHRKTSANWVILFQPFVNTSEEKMSAAHDSDQNSYEFEFGYTPLRIITA